MSSRSGDAAGALRRDSIPSRWEPLFSSNNPQGTEYDMRATPFAGAKAGDASLLVLLVETNPSLWEAGGEPGEAPSVRGLGFGAFLEQLIVFVQAFSLLNYHNKLVVIAQHGDGCHFLYDNFDVAHAEEDGGYEFAGTAGEIVARRMRELVSRAPQGEPVPSSLSGAPRHNEHTASRASPQPPRGPAPARLRGPPRAHETARPTGAGRSRNVLRQPSAALLSGPLLAPRRGNPLSAPFPALAASASAANRSLL